MLVHWPLMAPPSPLLAVPNVTAHPSTASVQITVLLYDCPLLCGFNVAIKGLKVRTSLRHTLLHCIFDALSTIQLMLTASLLRHADPFRRLSVRLSHASTVWKCLKILSMPDSPRF